MSRLRIFIPIGLLTVTLLAAREYRLAYPGALVVSFLDVGQGDSALIVSPAGKQVVIDGGPDLSALEGLGRHMPFFDRSIDLLVLSHPQLDHMAAFPEILRRYTVGAVLMTGVRYRIARYQEFLTLLKQQNIPILIADPAKDLDLGGGASLDVVWPPPTLYNASMKEVNNSSIVLRALYGGRAVLFTGDMEEEEERAVLASRADIDADVLKVAHHGSKTSSSSGFLLAVDPSLAVISVGRTNRYGHPHPAVVARYEHFGIPLRTTAEEGTITLRFGVP